VAAARLGAADLGCRRAEHWRASRQWHPARERDGTRRTEGVAPTREEAFMLAEEVVAAAADITQTDRLIVVGIAVQVLIGIALLWGQRKLARNQVNIANLLREIGER
jgi:hypothetical protein